MFDRSRQLKDLLWVIVCFGAVAIVFRLWFGLGATTNLSDALPWGLWKIANMVAGVALATSGFTLGFLVYVLKLERFRPLVKPAITLAFLGYGCSVFALLLDIGLPYRIWHPIVMWNEHSFLFEVAWCVMLYFNITMIELSPTVLERWRLEGLAHRLHRAAPAVVIVGIALSSLHHTSLGSLFLVTPQRLHPLWFTVRLPWLFILSAMGAGLMVVVLAKLVYARLYDPGSCGLVQAGSGICATRADGERREDDMPMLRSLAGIAAGLLGLFTILKLADLAATGGVEHLLTWRWESWFYLGELLTLGCIPVVLVLLPASRRSATGLAVAACSAVAGLLWNRLNVGLFGYFRDAGTVYWPSLAEWAVSLGVVAAAGLAFLYLVENYAIFDDDWVERRRAHADFLPDFDRLTGVWQRALACGLHRVTLLAVFCVPVAVALLYPAFAAEQARLVKPPVAKDAERTVLRIDGNHRLPGVDFPHRDHQQRLGGDRSCGSCHHVSMPRDHSTPCSRCHRDMELPTDVFQHALHFEMVATTKRLEGPIPSNHSCAVCHSPAVPKARASATGCLECHREDMAPASIPAEAHALARASGYRAAMHQTCIGCHLQERARVGRPELADCSTCHPSGSGAVARPPVERASLPRGPGASGPGSG